MSAVQIYVGTSPAFEANFDTVEEAQAYAKDAAWKGVEGIYAGKYKRIPAHAISQIWVDV